MIGPRCDAACREHPACALGAIGDYLVEACEAVEAEMEEAWCALDASAFDRMATAAQLMADTVAVVDRRVIDLHQLGVHEVCALGPGECWTHTLCVGHAVQARVRATTAIVVVTIEDALGEYRLLNPLAVSPVLELRRWVADRLEVHALETWPTLPGSAA